VALRPHCAGGGFVIEKIAVSRFVGEIGARLGSARQDCARKPRGRLRPVNQLARDQNDRQQDRQDHDGAYGGLG
jgi:hypothetical protein